MIPLYSIHKGDTLYLHLEGRKSGPIYIRRVYTSCLYYSFPRKDENYDNSPELQLNLPSTNLYRTEEDYLKHKAELEAIIKSKVTEIHQ